VSSWRLKATGVHIGLAITGGQHAAQENNYQLLRGMAAAFFREPPRPSRYLISETRTGATPAPFVNH
jgi:hypothetical protein